MICDDLRKAQYLLKRLKLREEHIKLKLEYVHSLGLDLETRILGEDQPTETEIEMERELLEERIQKFLVNEEVSSNYHHCDTPMSQKTARG